MFRTAIPVAVVLSLVRAADAQPSRDQTFDDLGRSLENIQRSLQGTKAPEPTPTGSLMTGVTVVPWKELNVFSSANAAATSAGIKIEPSTKLTIVGEDSNFFRVVPSDLGWKGDPLYVKKSDLGSSIGGMVSGGLSTAIQQMKNLARELENNPYVRIKGFKVSVSISPSLDIDFEMKSSDQPAAGAKP